MNATDPDRSQEGHARPRHIRAGVIGVGVMGRRMLESLSKHPDYEVTAVADADPQASARARGAYPGVAVRPSEDLVTADDVDLVYIATPPASHADLSVAAMEAGKSVLCEKPLAVALADGTRMCEAADRSGAVTAVNFPLSATPATRRLEQLLRAGAPGTVLGVDVRLNFPVWPRPFQATAAWVGEPAEGGFVREVFSHFAYLTDRLCGPLRPVTTGLDAPSAVSRGSETAAYGLLRAGDVPVVVSGHAGVAAAEQYEWILWGSEQSYLLKDWQELFVSTGGAWSPVDPSDEWADGDLLSQLARVIRGGERTDLPDFGAGLRVQRVVESFQGSTR
jgi:predicted dehydrogenase